MPEQNSATPGIDPTTVNPTAANAELAQQNGIREMAEAWVQTEPTEEWMADIIAKKFGLEGGKYDAYISQGFNFNEVPGSFSKLVNKEDPAEVLLGLSWLDLSGDPKDPDHNVTNVLLHNNGDITGRHTGENPYEIMESATNPDQATSYAQLLQATHTRAQDIAGRYEAIRSGAEATPRRKGALSKALGWFATRS